MADEQEKTGGAGGGEQGAAGGEGTQAAAGEAGGSAAAGQAGAGTAQAGAGRAARLVTMSREAIARQVRQARQGERAELAKLLGCKPEELVDRIQKLKDGGGGPRREPAKKGDGGGDGGHPRPPEVDVRKLQKERDELHRRVDELSRGRRVDERKRRQLQVALERKEAEIELRDAARGVGVKDVDYALHLLERELKGKSEAEINAFDERKFFGETLRERIPLIFQELTSPATTGATSKPPPASASQQAKEAGEKGQFDAMKASKDEINERLRRLGIPVMSN